MPGDEVAHTIPSMGTPSVSDVPDLHSTPERTIIDLRGADPFVSVGRYRYLAAHDPLPVQMHSRLIVLAFATRGRFDFVINDRPVGLEAGEAILVPPDNGYSTGRYAQTRGELIWMVLDGGPEGDAAPGSSSPARELVEDLLAYGVSICQSSAFTIELICRVLSSADERWPGVDLWRRSLCTAALSELVRTLKRVEPNSGLVHPELRRAVDWASANIESAMTVSDLLAASGMSSTRFYELFAATYGTSPKDYILRMKIDRASEILRTSTMSVTDVSHLFGFSSSQHFATAFKRYTGTSPSAFRARS